MDHAHTNPPPDGSSCPSVLELAAYIDGRSEQSEAIEAHLATCPECLGAVAGVRAVVSEPLPVVPPEVLAAAKALGEEPAPSLGSTDPGWWRSGGPLAFGRWAAGVAAAVAVCLAGYHVGSTMPSGGDTTDLTADLSFGLLDAEPDELELELFAMGSTGGRP